MQEVARNKYNDIIKLPRTRRGELVNICRSGGGGAEPYNHNAAYDLADKGYIAKHKNLNGYFIATKKGRETYNTLIDAINV